MDDETPADPKSPPLEYQPRPQPPHPIRRFFRQIGPAGPMALIVTCLPAIGAIFLFSLAPRAAPWLRSHGWLGVPTYANSILGGWTFKFAIGFPAVMAGLGGAAMIGYALAHRIVGHRVEDTIAQHPKWEIVRRALVGGSTLRTIGIITLLRLSPLLPFETTSVLLASFGVRPLPYLIGTLLGIAPRAAALVFFAAQARKLELKTAPHPLTIVIGLIVTAVSVVVLAVVAKHALDRAVASGTIPPDPS
jgi:uncharacterized membrane protein YdjX (TVP38/TMEM64 family)